MRCWLTLFFMILILCPVTARADQPGSQRLQELAAKLSDGNSVSAASKADVSEYCILLYNFGRYDQASGICSIASEKAADKYENPLFEGLSLYALGDKSGATAAFKRSMQVIDAEVGSSKERERVWDSALSKIIFRMGSSGDLRDFYPFMKEQYDSHIKSYRNASMYVRSLIFAGQYDEAESFMRRKEKSGLYASAAMAASKLHAYDRALGYSQKGLKLSGNSQKQYFRQDVEYYEQRIAIRDHWRNYLKQIESAGQDTNWKTPPSKYVSSRNMGGAQ